ncbi:MAG: hypothetical protein A3G87_01495 [Omnitrophica bacterium RIFCSPLOWO2_12_FULL_50_11]|nr:MAG: hypothetical protein A3G87_01495 [Omnitrophica bacterium RIFCSPLOWO2_12_FULL_50_11]
MEKHQFAKIQFLLLVLILSQTGCARIFGWDIHAPGILSEQFLQSTQALPQRIALYVPPDLFRYESRDRGSRTADPQTYHVGEAYGPMMVEAFQGAFDEFIFLETEPTEAIMRRYGIPYVVVIRIKEFQNRVTWRGHAIKIVTEAVTLDSHLEECGRFEATGISDAEKVFAKKGGPQVNLNAALENNILAMINYLQDALRTGTWPESQLTSGKVKP